MRFQGSRPKTQTFFPSSQQEAVPKALQEMRLTCRAQYLSSASSWFDTTVGDSATSLQKVQKSTHRGDECPDGSCGNRHQSCPGGLLHPGISAQDAQTGQNKGLASCCLGFRATLCLRRESGIPVIAVGKKKFFSFNYAGLIMSEL